MNPHARPDQLPSPALSGMARRQPRIPLERNGHLSAIVEIDHERGVSDPNPCRPRRFRNQCRRSHAMPSTRPPDDRARRPAACSAHSGRIRRCVPVERALTRFWPSCAHARREREAAHCRHLRKRRTDTHRSAGRSDSRRDSLNIDERPPARQASCPGSRAIATRRPRRGPRVGRWPTPRRSCGRRSARRRRAAHRRGRGPDSAGFRASVDRPRRARCRRP